MTIQKGWTPELDKVRWPFDPPPRPTKRLPMNQMSPVNLKVVSYSMADEDDGA